MKSRSAFSSIGDAPNDSRSATVQALQADLKKQKASTLATDTKSALTEKYAKQLWAVGGVTFLAFWQNAPKLHAVVDGK